MRGYANSRWGQVHWRAAGTAGPVVVLFHESPLSSAVYETALPYLGTSLRAWALDTPGYGLSDPPPEPAEIPAYAAALLEAVDALGIERFAVAGVHTGASLALQVALQAPARVTAAVFTGIPVLDSAERERYLASWAPPLEPRADGGHLRWAWERYQRIWGADSPAAVLDVGALGLLSNAARYNWAYQAAFRYDPLPDLRLLSCPVLFLTAEHDLLIDSDRRAVELVAQGRMRVVPGLRGQLPVRVPEVFAREVADFLLEAVAQPVRG